MQLAIKHRDPPCQPAKKIPLYLPRRYTTLTQLATGRRSEILLALPEAAPTLDQLVVIKAFSPERPGTAPAELAAELALASHLQHENIARTLSIGFESGRYFVVSEYLQGITLQSLLGWARLADQSLPSAAVGRILLGIVDALVHAARRGSSSDARDLINQPVAADDVFITYDGSVKLLGLKAVQRFAPQLRVVPQACVADELPSAADSEAQNVIDALLSSQLTPELGQLLARMANAVGTSSEHRVLQVREAMYRWLSEELGTDGRVELAEITSRAWPEARARGAAQLQSAFEELRARRDEASCHVERTADGPPVSQYRTRTSAASSGPPPPATHHSHDNLANVAVNPPGKEAIEPARSSPRLRWGMISAVFACTMLAASGVIHLLISGNAPARPASRLLPVQTRSALLQENAVSPRVTASAEPSPKHESSEGPLAALLMTDKAAPLPGRLARNHGAATSARRMTMTRGQPGYLTLDTTPWSNVSLEGASLGQTPLVGVEVPPGEHLLELTNIELGITSRYVVKITSGATTVRRIGLDQPKPR